MSIPELLSMIYSFVYIFCSRCCPAIAPLSRVVRQVVRNEGPFGSKTDGFTGGVGAGLRGLLDGLH